MYKSSFVKVILLITCIYINGFTQKSLDSLRNSQWIFGPKLGNTGYQLNFNNGSSISTGHLNYFASEGQASMADRQGNLLFYSNGKTIWNKLHQKMSNADGTLTSSNPWEVTSTSQGIVFVPMPCDTSKYFVFCNGRTYDLTMNVNRIDYSIVDMKLNGGLGDVVLNSRNTTLIETSELSEKMIAVPHGNGKDYWLCFITVPYKTSGRATFYAYLINSNGISQTPVITVLPENSTKGFGFGEMKANRCGNKIAYVETGNGMLTPKLFDFDNFSGIPYNMKDLPYSPFAHLYGVAFTENSKYLYVSALSQTKMVRYDLSQSNLIQETIDGLSYFAASVQLGMDGNMYVATYGELNKVINPESTSPTIEILSGIKTGMGLPNPIPVHCCPKLVKDMDDITINICETSKAKVVADAVENICGNYQWYLSTDGGNTYTALDDNKNYAGTKSRELTINYINETFHGYLYKIIVKEGACVDEEISKLTIEKCDCPKLLGNPVLITSPKSECIEDITSISVIVPKGNKDFYYQWYLNGEIINNESGVVSSNDQITINYMPKIVGSYTIKLAKDSILINDFECVASSEAFHLINREKIEIVGPDYVCETIQNVYQLVNVETSTNYSWQLSEGIQLNELNDSKTQAIATMTPGLQLIKILYTDQCDQKEKEVIKNILVIEKPVVDLGNDLILNDYQTIELKPNIFIDGTENIDWNTSGENSIITIPDSLITNIIVKDEYQEVTISISSMQLEYCKSEDQQKITVLFNLNIPNIFSPNNDNIHDQFIIEGIEKFPNAIVEIYNQWGELVYVSLPGYREPWDGKRNGQLMPVSTYYWIIHFNKNGYENRSGYLTLIK